MITVLRKLRSVANFWVAPQTLEHLRELRLEELDRVCELLPTSGRLLEVGGGTGWQAEELSRRGFNVVSIDLSTSSYSRDRVWPVQEYDGHKLPFPNEEFDIIFSSNVLEHIRDADDYQRELYRVLRPQGIACHVLPSSSWRFWTNLTHLLKWWQPPWDPHGEHAANCLEEVFVFRVQWWKDLFKRNGWKIAKMHLNHLFYTGNSLLDLRINIATRRALSFILGSSCYIFILEKSRSDSPIKITTSLS